MCLFSMLLRRYIKIVTYMSLLLCFLQSFIFLEFMSPLQGCIAWVVCGFYADTACRVPTVDTKNSRKVVPSRE